MQNKKINLSITSFILSIITIVLLLIFRGISELFEDSLADIIKKGIEIIIIVISLVLPYLAIIFSIKGRAKSNNDDKRSTKFGIAGFIIGLIFGSKAFESLMITLNQTIFKFPEIPAIIVFDILVLIIIGIAIIAYVKSAKKGEK